MMLSGNAIDHALLMLAAYTAGVPCAPVSVAYSLQSRDFAKLRHIAALVRPGLVYVADTAPFAAALAAIDIGNGEIVASRNGAGLDRVTPFDSLAATRAGDAVERAVAATGADTIAKFLFTSGSTGSPKGVINTHGMLTANQQQIAQIWPFLEEVPPVLVDWLPWNHTFGGNHNFNLVMRHAGTLYIDGGKPMPALVGETVKNLREISPTIYFNVPAGYAALLPFIERDEALAERFFAELQFIFYAGAALPQDLWTRLEAAAVRTTGKRIPLTSSWGTTETAPLATAAHFLADRSGMIGVPAPGIDVKLVPAGTKLEIRVRGPNVTPGYWQRPDLTAAAFDEEGFIGRATRCASPTEPIPARACCSMAASPKTSSSRPARGFMWAPCGSASSPPRRPSSRMPSSSVRTANSSASWRGSILPAAAASSMHKRPSLPPSPTTKRCASTCATLSRAGMRLVPARRNGSPAGCYCRTSRPSTPAKSPTRATSTNVPPSNSARARSNASLRANRNPRSSWLLLKSCARIEVRRHCLACAGHSRPRTLGVKLATAV